MIVIHLKHFRKQNSVTKLHW